MRDPVGLARTAALASERREQPRLPGISRGGANPALRPMGPRQMTQASPHTELDLWSTRCDARSTCPGFWPWPRPAPPPAPGPGAGRHLQEVDRLAAADPGRQARVYGLDDPVVEGVACHYTAPERGGISGTFGVAEEVSDISLSCRQVGPVRFKEKFEQGDGRLQRAPLAHLQAHADRARLRREAQHARLSGLFRPADRRLAEELDLERPAHALGHARPAPRCGDCVSNRLRSQFGCR